MDRVRPFDEPIYVTRPLLPKIDDYVIELGEIWESQWLTNGGQKHVALERALGKIFSNNNISLFNNGTIALVTACQALRLSGEVITTPFTFPATPHILAWNNITPVFADIDPVTMTLDPHSIEPLITGRTTGILGVHVYGIPCDVERIQEVADRHGLRIIYDAAHAFGTTIKGQLVTEFGDASMLSFHATKLFHTAEGGALIVRDAAVKARVDYLKNFGIKDEESVLLPGINGKMNELQAALGLLVLNMIEDEIVKRKKIAYVYCNRLKDLEVIDLPLAQRLSDVSFQYFPIRINSARDAVSRDSVYEGLQSYNVYARKYFYPLCSDYPCYRMLPSADPAYLPVARRVSSEVLCLPFYGTLGEDQANRICDMIEILID